MRPVASPDTRSRESGHRGSEGCAGGARTYVASGQSRGGQPTGTAAHRLRRKVHSLAWARASDAWLPTWTRTRNRSLVRALRCRSRHRGSRSERSDGWDRLGSNQRHLGFQPSRLPTEVQLRGRNGPARTGYLRPGKPGHLRLVLTEGVEPSRPEGNLALNAAHLLIPAGEQEHPRRDLNPGDRTENPAGCDHPMGGELCALRTGLEPVISRSTGGRPLQLDRQSSAEGGGVEPHGRGHDPGSNRAPGRPGVAFQLRRERGSNSHARMGLPFSRRLPSPAIGWSLRVRIADSVRHRTACSAELASPTSPPWVAAATARRSRPAMGWSGPA